MNYVSRYHVDSFKMINGGLRTLLGLCMAAAAVALPNPAAFGEPVGEWATVGDAGNAPDANGKGAVPYVFRISKTELTIGEYTTPRVRILTAPWHRRGTRTPGPAVRQIGRLRS